MADDDGEYRVGYGKPPKATQFKPKQSGNPRGRPPKQERSISRRQFRRDVLSVLEGSVPATIGGKKQTITINEALIQTVAVAALKGDLSAAKLLINLRQDLTQEHSDAHPELSQALEFGEQKFAESDAARLDPGSLDVFNEYRRRTRKV